MKSDQTAKTTVRRGSQKRSAETNKKGDRIAILTVNTPNIGKSEHHLVASKDVASGSILNKILASAELLGRKAISGQLWAN